MCKTHPDSRFVLQSIRAAGVPQAKVVVVAVVDNQGQFDAGATEAPLVCWTQCLAKKYKGICDGSEARRRQEE